MSVGIATDLNANFNVESLKSALFIIPLNIPHKDTMHMLVKINAYTVCLGF